MLRLILLAASQRQPGWIEQGFEDYARRFRGRCTLELKVVPLGRRAQGAPVARAIEEEGQRLLAAVPTGAHVVALTEDGAALDTATLAAKLERWMTLGAPVAFLVGGPDGLSSACLQRANERWSLSRLTLPHGLVRVMVAEALYRAWTVLEGHPYHRA